MVALLDAVDAAQRGGTDADARVQWDVHVLKSAAHRAFVPIAVNVDGIKDFAPGVLYVRAVSRPTVQPAVEQHSAIRDWIRTPSSIPRPAETVYLPVGEMPVGGPAISSSRRATQEAAERSAVLELQRRAADKQKAAEAARLKAATEIDPSLYPFEDYYFLSLKSDGAVRRAIALPPGQYDLYVAVLDRGAAAKGRAAHQAPVVLERRVTVQDFWDDQLRLSSLILTSHARTLEAPLARKEQGEHPYTFGLVDVPPDLSQIFARDDVLSIVYQICNYGSPDSDVTAEYRFFRTEPARALFNATLPQTFRDDDLPPPQPWESQTFAMQSVPLASFPPGPYELEVTVRDRLTRATAKAVAPFVVK